MARIAFQDVERNGERKRRRGQSCCSASSNMSWSAKVQAADTRGSIMQKCHAMCVPCGTWLTTVIGLLEPINAAASAW